MAALDHFFLLYLIFGIASAFIILQFVWQVVYYHFFHPLSNFPGPFWGGATRIWLAYQHWTGAEMVTLKMLHDKYGMCLFFLTTLLLVCRDDLTPWSIGPVIRVTPTMLLVSDSTKLPEMYNRRADKSEYYITPSFGPVENILVTRDHQSHMQLRKVMAGPYSISNVKKLEYLVDARVGRWFERIQDLFVSPGKAVDFTNWTV
jgi:hypothetical protein